MLENAVKTDSSRLQHPLRFIYPIDKVYIS